jgi:hypothetical protein
MELAAGLGCCSLVLQLCVVADGWPQEVPLSYYSQADRSGGAAASSDQHLISYWCTSPCRQSYTSAYAALQAPHIQQQLDLPLLIHQYIVCRCHLLRVHAQCIERIEGLSGCPKLRKLWLMENCISRIEGLEACTGLQELYLYSNRISSIAGLDHLAGLKVGCSR